MNYLTIVSGSEIETICHLPIANIGQLLKYVVLGQANSLLSVSFCFVRE